MPIVDDVFRNSLLHQPLHAVPEQRRRHSGVRHRKSDASNGNDSCSSSSGSSSGSEEFVVSGMRTMAATPGKYFTPQKEELPLVEACPCRWLATLNLSFLEKSREV